MNAIKEISDKSDDIIAIFDANGFFDKNIFCPKARLHIELQIKMQHKWYHHGEINLTSEELDVLISDITREEISETLYGLLDKGLLAMSINPDGEIVYSLAKGVGEIVNMGEYIKIAKSNK